MGFHAYYDFDKDGKNPTIIPYSDEYKWVAKTIIGSGVVVSLIIDILLLILTRGKNLGVIATKIQKIYKYTRLASSLAGANTYENKEGGYKFIAPQIAINAGAAFKKYEDETIGFVLEYTLSAAPLFAIQRNEEWTLGNFFANVTGIQGIFDKFQSVAGVAGTIETIYGHAKKAIPKDKNAPKEKPTVSVKSVRDVRELAYYAENRVISYFEKKIKDLLGASAILTLTFDGFIDAHITVKADLFQQSLSLFDGKNSYTPESQRKKDEPFKNQVSYGKKQGIDLFLKLDAKLVKTVKFSKLNYYVPDFLQDFTGKEFADVGVNATAIAEIKGTLYFERTYYYSTSTATAAAVSNLVDKMSSTKISEDLYEKAIKSSNLAMPVYRDNYIFSGLMGTVLVIVKKKSKNIEISGGTDDAGNSKPYLIEFIPGFVIPGEEIPVFSDFSKEK